jgi:hypothetical protein
MLLKLLNKKYILIAVVIIALLILIPMNTGDKKALEIIKFWEGFEPKAYKDAAGLWTIGWGNITGGQTRFVQTICNKWRNQ